MRVVTFLFCALVAFAAARVDGSPCAVSCFARMASCRAARCPDATGKARQHCRDACRAVIGCAAGAAHVNGTLATVVSECQVSGGMWTARQRLEVRRGDCPPVTVMTIDAGEPIGDLGFCQVYGEARDGAVAMAVGAFQGVAVSPDGETVLFQVTNDFVGRIAVLGFTIPTPPFTPPAEGIFVVRSDGSELRRIASPSREAPFVVRPGNPSPFIRILVTAGFSFSPDGKSVVFTDHGAGSDGSDAPQLFTLDPHTGTRRQLTSFTASSIGINPDGIALNGVFLEGDLIGGFVYDSVVGGRLFTMRKDGSDMRPFDPPVVVSGAQVVPDFRVTGFSTEITSLALARSTDVPEPGFVREVFVRDGANVLQLTNFGRSDTFLTIPLRDRIHVLIGASADPLQQNPSNTCQLFSVDRLGGHLRQLTRFDPGATAPPGCGGGFAPPGCTMLESVGTQDRATGAIVFDSTCDPFALSAVSQQVFAVRPSGGGLRQLTTYRGTTTAPDGSVDVELPGPVAYSASQ